MEENTNIQEVPQQNVQQLTEDKPKGLMPGQEHEDELDYIGAALFKLAKNGFGWMKHLFTKK